MKSCRELQGKGVAKEAVKPEWKVPFHLLLVSAARPVLLAEWKEPSAWTVVPAALCSILPDVKPEEICAGATRQ